MGSPLTLRGCARSVRPPRRPPEEGCAGRARTAAPTVPVPRSRRPSDRHAHGSRSARARHRPAACARARREPCAQGGPGPGRAARRAREAVRRCRGGRRHRPRDRRRRVLLDARPVGLGQDDDPAHDRGLRAADRRPGAPPRPRRHGPRPVRARREHRVPGLRAVPAHDGRATTSRTASSIRRVAKPERDRRVAEALEMVRLEGYDRRKPASCRAASGSGSRSRARS